MSIRDHGSCAHRPEFDGFWDLEASNDEQVLAASVCQTSCPVRDACLAEALADDDLVGIWGGALFDIWTDSARRRGNARPVRFPGTRRHGRGCSCRQCFDRYETYWIKGRRSTATVPPDPTGDDR